MEPARAALKRLPLAQFAAIVAVCIAAGFVFHRAFTTSALLGPVVGAALIPALLVVLVRLRWVDPAPITSIVISVLGYVVFSGVALFTSTTALGLPTPDTMSAIGDGLGNGWARLLSTTLPVESGPAMVLVPTTAVWIASSVGLELVVRTRSVLAPLLPPTLALIAGVMFGVGGPGSNTGVVAIFVGLAALFLALRAGAARTSDSRDARSQARARRRVLVAVPAFVVIALFAAVVGPNLPGADAREPFDLREYRHDPIAPRQTANPLQLLKSRLADGDRIQFTVEASAPENWRLVVLDRFNGETWSQSGEFKRIGTTVPEIEGGTAEADAVEQRYRIHTLDGFFVPAAAVPESISPGNFGYSPRTGVLVTGRNSVRDLRYDVTSGVPRLPQVDLRTATASRGPRYQRFIDLPQPVPAAIEQAASEAVTGGYDFQKLARLQAYLRDSELFTYTLEAPTGHSYGHLRHFLTSDPAARRGTAEQFATAFAVLARQAGYPTRIVVGFRPGDDRARPGRYVVRGADAHAWPEVHFDGLGWIAFDPTPVDAAVGGEQAEPASSTVIEEAAKEAATGPEDPAPPSDDQDGRDPGTSPSEDSGGTPLALVSLLVVVGALVLTAGAVVLTKQRRRRGRRLASTPRARVVGAWQEVLERLGENGVRSTRSLTTREVAGVAADLAGSEAAASLTPLGALVNVALYASDAPAESDARDAWVHADAFVVTLVRRRSPWERLKASLDPRTVWFRH